MINESDKLLVNLFVNGHNLSGSQENFEKQLGDNIILKNYYQEKLQDREFIQDLIPHHNLTKKSHKNLLDEIQTINRSIFDFKEEGLIKKSLKFLDKPIFTIEF